MWKYSLAKFIFTKDAESTGANIWSEIKQKNHNLLEVFSTTNNLNGSRINIITRQTTCNMMKHINKPEPFNKQ